jgi:NTP pyrophosphatase (non-canonical NTP hydrolase)
MSNQNQNHSDTDTKQTVSKRVLDILKMAEDISDQDERNYVLMTQVYEYGYLQRQLAEECSELAQAALKLIRVWNDETPEDEQTAISLYIEELADVRVMLSMALQELDADEMQYYADICQYKRERLYDRLCDAATQGRGDAGTRRLCQDGGRQWRSGRHRRRR